MQQVGGGMVPANLVACRRVDDRRDEIASRERSVIHSYPVSARPSGREPHDARDRGSRAACIGLDDPGIRNLPSGLDIEGRPVEHHETHLTWSERFDRAALIVEERQGRGARHTGCRVAFESIARLIERGASVAARE